MIQIPSTSQSFRRWASVAAIVIAALLVGLLVFGFEGYVQSWGGTVFKALSGGLIGWAVSRYVVRLDLSEIAADQRPLAALSQAILIGLFALALATGA